MKKKICWALDKEMLEEFEKKCNEIGLKYSNVAEKLLSKWLKIGTKVIDNQLNKAVGNVEKELNIAEKQIKPILSEKEKKEVSNHE